MKYLFLSLIPLVQFSFAQLPKPVTKKDVLTNQQYAVPSGQDIHTPSGRLFEQPAMNADDIAIIYFKLTGKRVLPSQAASAVEIKIVQPGPLTNQEVVELIETKLMMEGFALIESPGNPRQMRLVPAAGGNNGSKSTGVKLYTEMHLLPNNDEIVAYMMRLNYIKPDEASSIFQSVIGQMGPASAIVPIPNASSIIITDNALLIRSLIAIKELIDVPSSNVSTKFIELVYADAEEVKGQLEELINNEQDTTSSVARNNSTTRTNTNNNNARNNLPPSLQQAATANTGAATPSGGEDIPLKILADNRTNRLTLLGSPSKIAFAESLIAEFDKPSSDNNFIRRTLKYLPVTEFMTVAQNAIQATLSTSQSGGASGTNSNRANTNQRNNNNTNNNTNSSSRASISGQDGNTAPDSVLIGKTLLVADNISNAIIVDGPPHHIEIINNLIDELDQKSVQIAITALFGNYSTSSTNDFSIDFMSALSADGIIGAGFSGSTAANVSNIFSADLISDIASTLGGNLSTGLVGNNFSVFVDAAKTYTNLTEISRPTVFTTNNRSARLSSGSRIAIPTGTFSNAATTASTNYEFRDVTLDLEVRPLVNGKEDVTLEIALVNDSVGPDREVSDDLTIPDILSQELSTIVTVPDQSLIVLGGLYLESDSNNSEEVPLLSSIPLLGRLFTEKDDEDNLSELVIMVHTRIVEDTNDIMNFQRDHQTNSYAARETRKKLNANTLLEDDTRFKRASHRKPGKR